MIASTPERKVDSMNFSSSIKREILSKPIKERRCKKAFLAGLVRGTGELYEKDEELGLDIRVFDEETAMLITSFVKSLFNYEIRDFSVSEDRLSDWTNFNHKSQNFIKYYGRKVFGNFKGIKYFNRRKRRASR